RFDLRVALEGLHAELAAEAGLLEAAERRRGPDRAVRVDRQDAGLDSAGDADGAGAVPRPDRAGGAVRRVGRLGHRVGLVVERDDGDDRAEDVFAGDPVVVAGLDDRARKPVPGRLRDVAAETARNAVEVGADRRSVLGADEGSHLRLLVARIADHDL